MTFNSEYLGLLASQAPREEVETEVRILAGIFGVVDQGKVDSVTPECMTQGELAELRKWNRRLDANTKRDRRGEGARLFWAAQALASTVTSTSAFDQAWENPAVAEMMSAGADGLFEVGRPQFLCLAMTVQKIISWCLAKKFKNIGVIESPLGNSLPAEILRERAMAQGLTSAIVAWTLPRNDNPSKGRTIRGAARELVEMTTSFDVVIYIDDAITGTRYIKQFDALLPIIGEGRFVPIAMLFEGLDGPSDGHANLNRLAKRVEEQAKIVGLPTAYALVKFPRLPSFQIEEGLRGAWESPVIWGESDLIAGKRKVNLIFTLIGHYSEILSDLEKKDSKYRTYLERAWGRDVTGSIFTFAPGLLQAVIKNIAKQLSVSSMSDLMHKSARDRFKDDYEGKISEMSAESVEIRISWLRDEFFREIGARVGQSEAQLLWNAAQAIFSASLHEHVPRASRDRDDSPYTLRYNPSIRALNRRLRQLVGAAGERIIQAPSGVESRI